MKYGRPLHRKIFARLLTWLSHAPPTMTPPTLKADFAGLLSLAFTLEPPTFTKLDYCAVTEAAVTPATNPALRGIPTGDKLNQVTRLLPLDW